MKSPLIVALCLLGNPVAQDAPLTTPLTIPDAAAIAEAEPKVSEWFKDYAKSTPAQKSEVAFQMMFRIRYRIDRDPPAERYILHRDAQAIYFEIGELHKCFQVIEEWGTAFDVPVADLKSKHVETLAKSAKTPADLRLLVRCQLSLADSLIRANRYPDAEKTAQGAVATAKKSGSAPSHARAVAKGKEVADLKSQYEKTKKARETLAATPDDPASNLAVGRFECLVKANWEAGLPFLAKGPDGALRDAAAKDLALPGTPEAQLALGDEWWALSEKAPAADRDPLVERALTWYRTSAPKQTLLDKARTSARLSEVLLQRTSKGPWVELMDPKLYGLPPGKPGAPFPLKAMQRIDLAALPKGEFDALLLRFRPADMNSLGMHLTYQKGKRAVSVAVRNRIIASEQLVGTMWTKDAGAPLEPRPEHVLMVQVFEEESAIYLDGVEKVRVPVQLDRVDGIGLIPVIGDVTIDSIRLRRKGG